MQRRKFLQNSARAVAAVGAFPAIVPASALGSAGTVAPSRRIVLGCIGVGGMGTGHVRGFLQHADVRVAAVCDVRREFRDRAKGIVDAFYGDNACATYNDFRELLARPDIDAVTIATPEHWHGLIGIEAARRGKHMYYEKPLCLSVTEAQAVRAAVERYGVVFQFGTQQRSSHYFRHTCELVRNGRIGELKTIAIGSAPGPRNRRVPETAPEPIPDGFDYDMWLGPAPWAPHTAERVSSATKTWMFISDYGLGSLGGAWGIHDVDNAQWLNDSDHTGPLEVEGRAKFFSDIRDVPYSWEVEHLYANGVRLVHMDLVTARERMEQFRLSGYMASVVVGSEGWIYVSRRGMQTHPKSLMGAKFGPNDVRVERSDDHRRNFLDAIYFGRRPISHIEAAVRTETICQQAYIALCQRRKLRWDPEREVFPGDARANRMLRRPMRSPWRT